MPAIANRGRKTSSYSGLQLKTGISYQTWIKKLANRPEDAALRAINHGSRQDRRPPVERLIGVSVVQKLHNQESLVAEFSTANGLMNANTNSGFHSRLTLIRSFFLSVAMLK